MVENCYQVDNCLQYDTCNSFVLVFHSGKLKLATGRYTIFDHPESRSHAKKICGIENGHVVAFETLKEYDAVTQTENGWHKNYG